MMYILCSLLCFLIAAIYKLADDSVRHTQWTTTGVIVFIVAFLLKVLDFFTAGYNGNHS